MMDTIQGNTLEDAAGTTSQMQSAEKWKGLNENMRESQPNADLFAGLSKPVQQKPAKAKPRTCQHASGCPKLAQGRTMFCANHGGGRRCEMAGCPKLAQGSTSFCASHGGGRRCQHEDCIKSAAGATQFCKAHGGGKRCQHPGCIKSSQGSTPLCMAHGGGRRCKSEGCFRIAISTTSFCRAHGGQRICRAEGCGAPINGNRALCAHHGGGAGYRRRPGREEGGDDNARARPAPAPAPARPPPDRQRAPQVLDANGAARAAPPLRKPERAHEGGAWVRPQDRAAKPVRNVVILPVHNNPPGPHRAPPSAAPDAGALHGRHHLAGAPSVSDNEHETTTALLSLRQLAVYKNEGEGGGAAGKEVDTTLCLGGGGSAPRAAPPLPTVRPRTPRSFGRVPAHRVSNGRMAPLGVGERGLRGGPAYAQSTTPASNRDYTEEEDYANGEQPQEQEYEGPAAQFDDSDWPDLAGLTPAGAMAVPSNELAEFLLRMGALSETTRHEPMTWRRVHSSLEEYIATQGLFEPHTNMVECDQELRPLFRGAPKVAAHHVAALLEDVHWCPTVLGSGLADARRPKRARSPSAHVREFRDPPPAPDAATRHQAAVLTGPHAGSQGAATPLYRTPPQASAVSSRAYPAPTPRRDQEAGLLGYPGPERGPCRPPPEEPRRSTWGDLAAAAKQLPHPRRASGEGPHPVQDRARASAIGHQAASAQRASTGRIAGAGEDSTRGEIARPSAERGLPGGWIRRPPSTGGKPLFSRPQDSMHHIRRQDPTKAAQLHLVVPSQRVGSLLPSSQSKTSREYSPVVSAHERVLIDRTEQMKPSLLQRGVKRSRVARPSYSG
mmetsp:Transcript_35714/g.68506  ORF Transcript_35714/g.68506 Transcript_35714/m.68506 type:complete len:837 (+) Transcript_35714:265-2775(+)|eukprot:CAMPEP_0114254280 /NCGR_PEP_ID=MMETSP0058-20121206/16892_1 /TAXON_ID=36894 /ORGANISM="Pyramimonas parkeae, CCMP726" /LENGTH=836 /DNA_ID=CAMNT_0001368483 /DNA_START=198 /DNA_END=2708 /DNA_ORIENTATION=+